MDEKSAAILNKPTCSQDEAAPILRLSRPPIVPTIKRKVVAATKVGTRYIIPTAPLRLMLHVEDATGHVAAGDAGPGAA